MHDFLSEPFMRHALASGVLAGGLCAFLGVFLVLRRMVFAALALSELAACGVALGLWLHVAPPLCASIFCLGGIGLLLLTGREWSISRESMVGAVYALSAALALIVMAIDPLARARGLDLLARDLLYSRDEHVVALAALTAATAVCAVFFLRKLLFSFFDREMAISVGVPARRLECGFLILVALVIAFSLHVAGAVLVFASLILPPLFGLAVGRRTAAALVLAPIAAVVSCACGLFISYRLEEYLPTCPAIVMVYGLVTFCGIGLRWLASRRR